MAMPVPITYISVGGNTIFSGGGVAGGASVTMTDVSSCEGQ
jgi:hypothetical protein